MHDDHDRPGAHRAPVLREDQRRSGHGPDEDPPIDAERDPGGARHLATGAGGAGDWIASAAGIGQRRGPADDDRPFDVDDDANGWASGGGADAGSMQGRPVAEGSRDDARIHDDVRERLSRSHLDAGDVSVEVRDGHVTLSGTVSDRPMKHSIESLVDGCGGVRHVDDRLKLMRMPPDPGAPDAPPQPHASVPQDSPTARDEARGRFSLPLPGGAGKSG
ncbi:MAG: BON domain-containing protein [Burkholderiaceae bacterium]|jgi:hypothetical protein|nr:BON domain-containing protein [Burkholderiales bacterium]MCZ8337460.1 BON domain-containing protein [Burkholderiaceae bacterium]